MDGCQGFGGSFEYGDDSDEESSHDGDDGLLVGFSFGSEFGVEFFAPGLVLDGSEGGHVEDGLDS
jgi:hypothetical protein